MANASKGIFVPLDTPLDKTKAKHQREDLKKKTVGISTHILSQEDKASQGWEKIEDILSLP